VRFQRDIEYLVFLVCTLSSKSTTLLQKKTSFERQRLAPVTFLWLQGEAYVFCVANQFRVGVPLDVAKLRRGANGIPSSAFDQRIHHVDSFQSV
jgi:hypothetical protein